MNLRSWLAATVWFTTVISLTITEDTVVVSPVSLSIGDLTINPDVYYSIVNNLLTTLGGNLDNQGGFYVTSSNGLAASVTIVSGTIKNSGDLAFNSLRANVASIYNLNSIGSFENTGNMWIGISSFSVTPPIILGSALDWDNSGKIYLSQAAGTPSTITISQALGSVNNDGTICIERLLWLQTTSITGSGCINVMDDATLQLQLSPWNVADTETVYLSSESSLLSVLGLAEGLTGTKTYTVVGFGNGNEIRVNTGFTSWSYSNGILTLSFFLGVFRLAFDIGPGYSNSGFSTNGVLGAGTRISYSDAYPGAVPDICLCADFPEPTTTPLASSTIESSSSVQPSRPFISQ